MTENSMLKELCLCDRLKRRAFMTEVSMILFPSDKVLLLMF